MELHIKKVLAEAIGFASLAKFGFDKSWDNWKKSDSIDLTRKDDDELVSAFVDDESVTQHINPGCHPPRTTSFKVSAVEVYTPSGPIRRQVGTYTRLQIHIAGDQIAALIHTDHHFSEFESWPPL